MKATSFKIIAADREGWFLVTYKDQQGVSHTLPAPVREKALASRIGRSLLRGEYALGL